MKSSMLKYKWMCLALACCALFAACEPASVATDNNSISFGAGRKNSSYNNNASNTNAYLWGYKTNNSQTETIFDGVEARLYDVDNTNTSIYDDIEIKSETKYWNIGTYNFFSVSPKLTNASATNAGLTITDFDISSQTDIIAAATTGISVNKLEYNTPVTLNYKHLLTKIKFQAQTTQSTCTITAFSVTVPKTATYTSSSSSWGTKSDSYSLEMPEDQEITTSPVVLDLDGITGTNDNGWLIYPGIVIADNETTTDVNEAIAYSITYTVGDTEKTETGTLPALKNTTNEVDGGLAGNSYIYTFKITPAGPIVFDDEVTINDWGTETEAGDVQF